MKANNKFMESSTVVLCYKDDEKIAKHEYELIKKFCTFDSTDVCDFLSDLYEKFLTEDKITRQRSEGITAATTNNIESPFDLMKILTERYFALQRLRNFNGIKKNKYDAATRLNVEFITIYVVKDKSSINDNYIVAKNREITRHLFSCFLSGRTFVQSDNIAQTIISWIRRMQRILRLPNNFVVYCKSI